jgi:YegS/Rv2252/BmrU family lipid kinase
METIKRGKAVIIANPAAGRVTMARLDKARATLEGSGMSTSLMLTRERGDARAFAKKAVSEEPALIFAAGGDGTINEVINGMAGSLVPLAILPLGTANVLAMETGVPASVEGALRSALEGSPKTVSLGEITSGSDTRLFCLMAGAGFDAETVCRIEARSKGLGGKPAYVLTGLGVLAALNAEEIKVEVDGTRHACNHVIVSNGRKYAGYFSLAPDADICSSGFVITLIKGAGRLRIASFAALLLLGMHRRLGFVETLKGSEVLIEGRTRVQIDGDHFGDTPVSIRAVPEALRLVF